VGREEIRTETVKEYLFTIARNLYLKGLRRTRRQSDLDPLHTDPKPVPEQQVESRLELDRAMQAIQSLPETDRTAFLLRVQYEMPYAEIARTLQLPITTVKVKVHRARLKITAGQIGENR